MRLLLVEDNPAEAMLIREQVAGADPLLYGLSSVEFIAADSLETALAVLRFGNIDMIISDLGLPDSSGLDTVTALLEAAPAVPLIVLTGNEDRRIGRDAVQRGAQDFLIKRLFTADTLLRAVIYARERQQLREKIAQLAIIDELTGLPNRRHCFAELHRMLPMAQRYGAPLAVAIADIDHFKLVNDTHGHLAGDEILRAVAANMRATLRTVDVICRYGGEEFILLLPETGMQAAQASAERVRLAVAAHDIRYEGGRCAITISIGATVLRPDDSIDSLLARADRGLYLAKESGRNCCVFNDGA